MMKWSLHEGSLFSSLNCFRRTVPPKSGKVLTSIKSHGKLKLGSWMAPFRKCPLDPLAVLWPQWITFVLFLKTSCLTSFFNLFFFLNFIFPGIFCNFYRSMKTKCRINVAHFCHVHFEYVVIRPSWLHACWITHIFHGENNRRKRDSLCNYFNCRG